MHHAFVNIDQTRLTYRLFEQLPQVIRLPGHQIATSIFNVENESVRVLTSGSYEGAA